MLESFTGVWKIQPVIATDIVLAVDVKDEHTATIMMYDPWLEEGSNNSRKEYGWDVRFKDKSSGASYELRSGKCMTVEELDIASQYPTEDVLWMESSYSEGSYEPVRSRTTMHRKGGWLVWDVQIPELASDSNTYNMGMLQGAIGIGENSGEMPDWLKETDLQAVIELLSSELFSGSFAPKTFSFANVTEFEINVYDEDRWVPFHVSRQGGGTLPADFAEPAPTAEPEPTPSAPFTGSWQLTPETETDTMLFVEVKDEHTAQIILYDPQLQESYPVNRDGVDESYLEYGWGVGFEDAVSGQSFRAAIRHFKYAENGQKNLAPEDMQISLWMENPEREGSYRTIPNGATLRRDGWCLIWDVTIPEMLDAYTSQPEKANFSFANVNSFHVKIEDYLGEQRSVTYQVEERGDVPVQPTPAPKPNTEITPPSGFTPNWKVASSQNSGMQLLVNVQDELHAQIALYDPGMKDAYLVNSEDVSVGWPEYEWMVSFTDRESRRYGVLTLRYNKLENSQPREIAAGEMYQWLTLGDPNTIVSRQDYNVASALRQDGKWLIWDVSLPESTRMFLNEEESINFSFANVDSFDVMVWENIEERSRDTFHVQERAAVPAAAPVQPTPAPTAAPFGGRWTLKAAKNTKLQMNVEVVNERTARIALYDPNLKDQYAPRYNAESLLGQKEEGTLQEWKIEFADEVTGQKYALLLNNMGDSTHPKTMDTEKMNRQLLIGDAMHPNYTHIYVNGTVLNKTDKWLVWEVSIPESSVLRSDVTTNDFSFENVQNFAVTVIQGTSGQEVDFAVTAREGGKELPATPTPVPVPTPEPTLRPDGSMPAPDGFNANWKLASTRGSELQMLVNVVDERRAQIALYDPNLKDSYTVNRPQVESRRLEYGWRVHFGDSLSNQFFQLYLNTYKYGSKPKEITIEDMQHSMYASKPGDQWNYESCENYATLRKEGKWLIWDVDIPEFNRLFTRDYARTEFSFANVDTFNVQVEDAENRVDEWFVVKEKPVVPTPAPRTPAPSATPAPHAGSYKLSASKKTNLQLRVNVINDSKVQIALYDPKLEESYSAAKRVPIDANSYSLENSYDWEVRFEDAQTGYGYGVSLDNHMEEDETGTFAVENLNVRPIIHIPKYTWAVPGENITVSRNDKWIVWDVDLPEKYPYHEGESGEMDFTFENVKKFEVNVYKPGTSENVDFKVTAQKGGKELPATPTPSPVPTPMPRRITHENIQMQMVGNGWTITGCQNAKGDFVVPAEIDGFPVTVIGENAFEGSAITSITLPESVQTIKHHAFANCKNLQTINIPDGVATISAGSFMGCTALENISLPRSVQHIGAEAFSQSGLAAIQLPDGLISLGAEAFGACKNLKEITVPAQLNAIGTGAFWWCTSLEKVTLSPGLREIGDKAFYMCESLESMDLPKGVFSIGDDAFYKCTSLRSVGMDAGLVSIGLRAFYGCTALEAITIPQGVALVQPSTFYGCESLRSVSIPASVSSIKDEAFYNCVRLETVALSEGLTTIGNGAFMGCESLSEITIPKSVVAFGDQAFAGDKNLLINAAMDSAAHLYARNHGIAYATPEMMKGLEYEVSGDRVIVTGYDAGATTVELPSRIEGRPVTAVGPGAFRDSSIQSIRLPEGITSIGESAFEGCLSLDSINLPSTLETIGKAAFSNCITLKSIEIPAKVTALPEDAFYACLSLEKAILPEKLKTIGDGAFENCSNLTGIILPPSVRSVANRAFMKCISLRDVQIMDGVETFGNYAFGECSALENLVLPNSVKEIGPWMFNHCTGLKEITLSKQLTVIPRYAFSGCEKLESVVVPENVKVLEDGAFMECSGMKEISLPEGLTTLGNEVFDDCESLTSVVLPQSVTSMGTKVFYYCPSLKQIILPEGIKALGDRTFHRCSSLKMVALPDGLETIGSYAFEGCSALESLSIPSSVVNFGHDAFYECNKLTITAENGSVAAQYALDHGIMTTRSNPDVKMGDFTAHLTASGWRVSGYNGKSNKAELPAELNDLPVTSVHRDAFGGNEKITAVTLPDTITEIAAHTFEDCTALTSVTMSKQAEVIGSRAFSGCVGLEYLYIPASVTEIAQDAFEECENLTLIIPDNQMAQQFASQHNIPYVAAGKSMQTGDYIVQMQRDNTWTITKYGGSEAKLTVPGEIGGVKVKAIGDYAFAENHAIKSVVISEGVEKIGMYAFNYCAKLTSVQLPSTLKLINMNGFSDCLFLKTVNFPDGLEIIGSDAFSNSMISSVVVPDSVKEIHTQAFRSCTRLKKVQLPKGLTEIADGLFYDCRSLNTVNIPDGVKKIGVFAFEYTAIKSLELPEGLQSIQLDAFADCAKLTSLTIPSTVKEIDGNPFTGSSPKITVAEGNAVYAMQDNMLIHKPEKTVIAYVGSGKEAVVPEGVEKIGRLAFMNRKNLVSVEIPDSVTYIDYNAFMDCPKLTSVSIPDSVTFIGQSAFQNCTALQSVTLPKGLEAVEYNLFSGCTNLRSVIIPDSVKEIRLGAFDGCEKVTIVGGIGSAAQRFALENGIPHQFPGEEN